MGEHDEVSVSSAPKGPVELPMKGEMNADELRLAQMGSLPTDLSDK